MQTQNLNKIFFFKSPSSNDETIKFIGAGVLVKKNQTNLELI